MLRLRLVLDSKVLQWALLVSQFWLSKSSIPDTRAATDPISNGLHRRHAALQVRAAANLNRYRQSSKLMFRMHNHPFSFSSHHHVLMELSSTASPALAAYPTSMALRRMFFCADSRGNVLVAAAGAPQCVRVSSLASSL